MMEQIPSISLVHEAHDLFSQLSQGYKKENLQRIKELRERMIMHGFDAPFKAVLKRTYSEAEEDEEDNVADIKKQVDYFRQVAILKKGALRRSNVAIAAHLLAESFIKMGYGDIIDYLPFDGNYIDNLFKSGVSGVKVYRHLNDLIAKKGEVLPVYKVEVFFKGERFHIKVKNRSTLEEKVMQEFGPEGRIMDIKVGRKEYPIIKSKSIRIALISSIVSYLRKMESDHNQLKKQAVGALLSPILKFYLISSLQERKKNNLYYSLSNKPNEDQIKLFDEIKEVDPELKGVSLTLKEKLKLEKEMNIQSKLIGAGVLAKNSGKNKEWIAKYLKVTLEEVEKGTEYVKAYSEKGRGAEFLEHLK